MKKILLWGAVTVLILAIVAAAVWWEMRPQVITLKSGTKLTLVQVTYGTHHVFKGVTSGGRQRGHTTYDTTNDTVMLWIEAQHKPNQWPNYQVLVYDPDDTACVGAWQRTSSQVRNGIDVEGFALDGYPRRSAKMIVRISAWNNNGGMDNPKGQFVISNPGPRSFPDWQPDALPNTQSDGDLDVTLTKCSTSSSQVFFDVGNGSSKDPRHRGVQVDFHTVQKGNVVTNWQPVRVVTSDATGNSVPNSAWSNSQDDNGDAKMTYQWGLWPSEKAWKLRVEMSRTTGFSNDEIWTVPGVPVQKGSWQDIWNYGPRNGPKKPSFAETMLDGHHLEIFPVTLVSDQNFGSGQKQAGFRVSVSPDVPEGYRLTLAAAIDDQGHNEPIPNWGPGGGAQGNYIFQLPNFHDAKTLNLTIALHQSRFVEFMVKPTN